MFILFYLHFSFVVQFGLKIRNYIRNIGRSKSLENVKQAKDLFY